MAAPDPIPDFGKSNSNFYTKDKIAELYAKTIDAWLATGGSWPVYLPQPQPLKFKGVARLVMKRRIKKATTPFNDTIIPAYKYQYSF
jgi:hypothetical protein